MESSFIINLWAGHAPPKLARLPDEELQYLTVFTSRSLDEGRARYRLHLGYFPDESAAQRILQRVRAWYPSAWVVPADRHTPLARLPGVGPAPVWQEEEARAATVRIADVGEALNALPLALTTSSTAQVAERNAVAPPVLGKRTEAIVVQASINSDARQSPREVPAPEIELYALDAAPPPSLLPSKPTSPAVARDLSPALVLALLEEPVREVSTFRGDGAHVRTTTLPVSTWKAPAPKAKPKPKTQSWLKRLTA